MPERSPAVRGHAFRSEWIWTIDDCYRLVCGCECGVRFDALSEPQGRRAHREHKASLATVPTVAELTGIAPDWTGGMSSDEYVRYQRGPDD